MPSSYLFPKSGIFLNSWVGSIQWLIYWRRKILWRNSGNHSAMYIRSHVALWVPVFWVLSRKRQWQRSRLHAGECVSVSSRLGDDSSGTHCSGACEENCEWRLWMWSLYRCLKVLLTLQKTGRQLWLPTPFLQRMSKSRSWNMLGDSFQPPAQGCTTHYVIHVYFFSIKPLSLFFSSPLF